MLLKFFIINVILRYTYKEGTALSKETKLAKKEAKAAKKAAKLEKNQAAAYNKLVKKMEKKNAKLEKKANKKNQPFVPLAIPTQEEAFAAAGGESKAKKIIEMIVLILLLVYLGYFCYMFYNYVAPPATPAATTTEEGEGAVAEYDRYKNPHEITTTPDYSVADAKAYLKQVLHDNWKNLGYSADPSGGSINYTNSMTNVNNADCYVFTAGSKTYAVSVKLQSCYINRGGKYVPLTFHETDKLF